MKKAFAVFTMLLVLLLTGCRAISHVETLRDWSFQFNEGTNTYSVFFGFSDQSGNPISSEADVDIRIVNDNEETVYTASKSVMAEAFSTYTNGRGERCHLVEIQIPAEDLTEGTTTNGTVYLNVSTDTIYFDEVNCAALYCLPVSDIILEAQNLPIEINVNDFDGTVESKIRVDEITYTYENSYTSRINVTVIGTKTYGTSDSIYEAISYKVYDQEGFIVETGNLFLDALSEGDRFKDDSITIYDLVPGGTYTIEFYEYS